MTITAIATEGRFDEGRGQEYPTAYRLEYWRSSLHGWAAYKDDHGVEVRLLQKRGDRDKPAAIKLTQMRREHGPPHCAHNNRSYCVDWWSHYHMR